MFICWWWVSLCLVLYHSPHMYHENLEIVEARSACDVRLRAVCFLVKVLLLLAWLVCVCLTVLGFVYCGWPLLYITWCRWKKNFNGWHHMPSTAARNPIYLLFPGEVSHSSVTCSNPVMQWIVNACASVCLLDMESLWHVWCCSRLSCEWGLF